MAATPTIREVRETKEPTRATVRIRPGERSPHPIPQYITGKFCEHLGANILNGMDAQILRNPTFAEYPFSTGQMTPDGVTRFHADDAKIAEQLRRQAARFGCPKEDLDGLVQARGDGLACFWMREGPREAVEVSPDAGPHVGRAQRVAVREAGQGLAQWVWLPLHRVRRLQCEVFARSPDVKSLTVSLRGPGAEATLATAALPGLDATWRRLTATLDVPPSAPADGAYRLAVTADAPGQFVLGHVLLRPADHVA
ncbi:MAG: hypothetical protein IMZ66_03220, partial [Planctomycetes bacterium]|nr:hypothetical protein [Planctomycetota bacterium]